MAQKYGWYDGAVNTVGIVQTETPYLIAVFTDNLYDAENIIGKTNLIFYDYTVHLMEHQKLALAAAETEADAKAVLQAQQAVETAFSAAASDTAAAAQLAEALSQSAEPVSDPQPDTLQTSSIHFTAAYFSAAICGLLLLFLWIYKKTHKY